MKYEDIQVGDRVRTTIPVGDTVCTAEGVVAHKSGGRLTTGQGYNLLFPHEHETSQLELVEREKPGLPEQYSWVRFQVTYDSDKWLIGQVQVSGSTRFVETLDNVYDQDEISQFEEITWSVVDG